MKCFQRKKKDLYEARWQFRALFRCQRPSLILHPEAKNRERIFVSGQYWLAPFGPVVGTQPSLRSVVIMTGGSPTKPSKYCLSLYCHDTEQTNLPPNNTKSLRMAYEASNQPTLELWMLIPPSEDFSDVEPPNAQILSLVQLSFHVSVSPDLPIQSSPLAIRIV